MANIRYFNLKSLTNVKLSNMDPKTNVRRVFDPQNADWANYGNLTATSSFPKHVLGAGRRGAFLGKGFDLGVITSGSVDTIDYGSIA
tara:strand:+ start:93 stop:353 length:261 start_codon:yes stop_codon:yes gene_type:complete